MPNADRHVYHLHIHRDGTASVWNATKQRKEPNVRSIQVSTKLAGVFVQLDRKQAVFLMDDEIRRVG